MDSPSQEEAATPGLKHNTGTSWGSATFTHKWATETPNHTARPGPGRFIFYPTWFGPVLIALKGHLQVAVEEVTFSHFLTSPLLTELILITRRRIFYLSVAYEICRSACPLWVTVNQFSWHSSFVMKVNGVFLFWYRKCLKGHPVSLLRCGTSSTFTTLFSFTVRCHHSMDGNAHTCQEMTPDSSLPGYRKIK